MDVRAWHSLPAAVASRWSASCQQLNLNQLYFPIARYGIGLCPLGCNHVRTPCSALPVASSLVLLTIVGVEQPQPSEFCVGQRIAAAVQYGATEIDLWALWDSTASNWTQVETAWRP